MQEIEKLYRGDIDAQRGVVDRYQTELTKLGEKPKGWENVDLSSLYALSDAWNGTNTAASYKPPQFQKEWEAKKAALEGALHKGRKELSDQQVDLLKMKYGAANADQNRGMREVMLAMTMANQNNRQGQRENDQVFQIEKDFRHQHQGNQVTKNSREIERWYGMIDNMTKSKAGINDVALVNAINKMLDPASVVREKEFEIAAKSGGLVRQLQQWKDAKLTGQFLDPRTRMELVNLARGIAEEQGSRQSEFDQSLMQSIGDYKSMYPGLNPQRAIPTIKPESAKPQKSGGQTIRVQKGNEIFEIDANDRRALLSAQAEGYRRI
jgi:hypothetical protein